MFYLWNVDMENDNMAWGFRVGCLLNFHQHSGASGGYLEHLESFESGSIDAGANSVGCKL